MGPYTSQAPRASSIQDATAAAIPKPAPVRPASRAPERRVARAAEITTTASAAAATPSASTNMAIADPPCPANAATTWLPRAATAGFGAPTDTLMIQARL